MSSVYGSCASWWLRTVMQPSQGCQVRLLPNSVCAVLSSGRVLPRVETMKDLDNTQRVESRFTTVQWHLLHSGSFDLSVPMHKCTAMRIADRSKVGLRNLCVWHDLSVYMKDVSAVVEMVYDVWEINSLQNKIYHVGANVGCWQSTPILDNVLLEFS